MGSIRAIHDSHDTSVSNYPKYTVNPSKEIDKHFKI